MPVGKDFVTMRAIVLLKTKMHDPVVEAHVPLGGESMSTARLLAEHDSLLMHRSLMILEMSRSTEFLAAVRTNIARCMSLSAMGYQFLESRKGCLASFAAVLLHSLCMVPTDVPLQDVQVSELHGAMRTLDLAYGLLRPGAAHLNCLRTSLFGIHSICIGSNSTMHKLSVPLELVPLAKSLPAIDTAQASVDTFDMSV